MSPEQCQQLYARLKVSVFKSKTLANVLFARHSVNDWLKVAEYAITQGDDGVLGFLLTKAALVSSLGLQKDWFLNQAILKGHTPNISLLLELPDIRTHFYTNLHLKLSYIIYVSSLDTIKYFMADPKVLRQALAKSKNMLESGMNLGDLQIFTYLFSLEGMFDEDSDGFKLLEHAISTKHTAIFSYLMGFEQLRAIAAKSDNRLLKEAINRGNIPGLEILLNISQVKNTLTSNNHEVLRVASSQGQASALLKLLTHYPNTAIPLDIFSRIYHRDFKQDDKKNIIDKTFDRPLALSGRCVDGKKIEAMKAWSRRWGLGEFNMRYSIDPVRWADYLYAQMQQATEPKVVAIIILSLNKMAELHAAKQCATLVESGDESAMDKGLVAKCARHFDKHVKPHYKLKFDDFGGIEGIEKRIKEALFDKLMAQQPADVVEKMQLNRAGILAGNLELMDWMLKQCSDTSDVYHNCWRAYDPAAPVDAFDNLLTAPAEKRKQKAIFTIAETGLSKGVQLKSGSDIIRERACYFFLVATDEKMTPDQWDVAMEAFFAAISEIRRSNNKDEDNEPADKDSPSCFPGCFTQLGLLSKFNSFIHPMDLVLGDEIKQYFRSEFDQILVKIFMSCQTKQAVAQVVDALTLLTYQNAWDIINKPWKVDCPSLSTGDDDLADHTYDQTLLAKRNQIIRQYFSVPRLLKAYDMQMPENHKFKITQHDRIFVQDCIVDLGRGDHAPLIISYANARLVALGRNERAPSAVSTVINITGHKRTKEQEEVPVEDVVVQQYKKNKL